MRDGSQMLDRRLGAGNGVTTRSPPHGRPEAGVLESELKRALDRAARRETETKAIGTPPGWEPIFMARGMSGNAARETASRREISGRAPLPVVTRENAQARAAATSSRSPSRRLSSVLRSSKSVRNGTSRAAAAAVCTWFAEATPNSAAVLYAVPARTRQSATVQPATSRNRCSFALRSRTTPRRRAPATENNAMPSCKKSSRPPAFSRPSRSAAKPAGRRGSHPGVGPA